jgi:hypothetical protein
MNEELSQEQQEAAAATETQADSEQVMNSEIDQIFSRLNETDNAEQADEKPAEGPNRDERGRFAKSAAEDEQQDATDEAEHEEADADAEEDGEVQDIEPPGSWTRSMLGAWEKLEPEQKEFIAKRESWFRDRFAEQGRVLKYYEPMTQVINEHAKFFESTNTHPSVALNRLMNEWYSLHQNPMQSLPRLAQMAKTDLDTITLGNDPVASIQRLAEKAGIDLIDVALGNVEPSQAKPQQASQPDPALQQMQSRIKQLESALLQAQQQQTQDQPNSEEQELFGTIDRVAQQFEDFDELAPLVAMYLPNIREANPHLTPEDWLTLAYDRAAQFTEKQVEKRAGKLLPDHTAKANKAKAASIKGNGASSKPAPLTEDQEVDQIWAKAGLPS